MRTNKILFLTTFLLITLFQASYGQSVELLSKTVVFVCQKSFAYEIVRGQRVEVWYKRPDTGDYERKIVNNLSATAFVLKHNGRDYLVTAKHVANKLQSNIAKRVVNSTLIVVNEPNGKALKLDFEVIQGAKILSGARWFYHSTADIAIHPLCYPQGTKVDFLAIRSVDCPKTDKSMPLLSTVYILGFPLGLGVQEVISPVAKETQLASNVTSLSFAQIDPSLKYILLDQALAQGYSGAPIFCAEEIESGITARGRPLKAGEKLHLIGIMSQVVNDETGGKISLIVPISYLWDILQSPDFLAYEKRSKKNNMVGLKKDDGP